MAYERRDLSDLRSELVTRAMLNSRDAAAWMDLSTILYIHRLPHLADASQRQALELQAVFRLPAVGRTPALRLLATMTAGDLSANLPLEFLVQGSDVQLDMLYLGNGIALPEELPAHDVAIVAIAQCDRHEPLLWELRPIVEHWPYRVLNRPERISALTRTGVAKALADLPGVCVPSAVRLSREELWAIGGDENVALSSLPGRAFPVIVRPVDSHAGRGLARLETRPDISAYLAEQPGEQFYLSTYVDCRGPDGRYRKYRIALVDGIPYACHMAISETWVVHYLSAGMTQCAAKRAEEAQFLERFDSDFRRRHADALEGIYQRLGLDYLVLDCSETQDGRLLVWEADSCGVVHAMDPEDMFAYKRPPMKKVFAAFLDMLKRAAGAH